MKTLSFIHNKVDLIVDDEDSWYLLLLFTFQCMIFKLMDQLICLSDLEYDYINLYDSSSRINAMIIPEFVVQGALCKLLILTWH